MVKHPVQKVVCLLNFIFSMMQHVFDVREVLDGIKDKNDPLVYFKLANIASDSAFWLSVFISLWCRSKEFQIAFNHVQILGVKFQCKKGHKAIYWTPAIIIATYFLYPILHVFNFFQMNDWDFIKTVEMFKGRGIKVLFLEDHVSSSFASNIPLTIVFTFLNFLFLGSAILLGTFGEILLLNSALCMGDMVDEFEEIVKKSGSSSVKVIEHYSSLRQASDALNDAVGVSVFGEVLTALPYFVNNFVEFIHPGNLFIFTLHFIEFGNIFGFVLIAANVHRKANNIEDWILEHHDISHLSLQNIKILIHNISTRSIAFDGCGFLKITSGFVGSFVSLLLTFSVILIQFRETPCCEFEEKKTRRLYTSYSDYD